jgi:hypothetical protein
MSGACKRHTPVKGCVMFYDFETGMKNVHRGALGLVDFEITVHSCDVFMRTGVLCLHRSL